MATKKWVPIAVGVVIFVVLVGAGLLGSLLYVVKRQVKVQTVTAASGQEEFDRMAERMAGQKPFVELPAPGSGGEPIIHHEMETHPTGSISTVHVLVWSPRDNKLARIDLPFWLMRLGGNHPFTFNSGLMDEVRLQVTPEEIDRRGPGLILNWTTERGNRLLVWTE